MTMQDRFFTAAQGTPPTEAQKAQSNEIREKVVELGVLINEHVPGGRNQSLALTHLEDVLMRANRGIFAPSDYK